MIATQEVETPMHKKLEDIEEQVAVEKTRQKNCREATRRSLAALYELLTEHTEETNPASAPASAEAELGGE